MSCRKGSLQTQVVAGAATCVKRSDAPRRMRPLGVEKLREADGRKSASYGRFDNRHRHNRASRLSSWCVHCAIARGAIRAELKSAIRGK